MANGYTTFNRKVQNMNFGEMFRYDGIHDTDSKKWPMRDEFVAANLKAVKVPVKEAENIYLGRSSMPQRLEHALKSKEAWEYIANAIENGSGTVYSYDVETIGDISLAGNDYVDIGNGVMRKTKGHIYDVIDEEGKIVKTVRSQYDGYAGITELGIARGVVEDAGVMLKTRHDSVTFAVPLSAQQIHSAYEILDKYKRIGESSLNENEEWMLKWFSKYGGYDDVHHYFGTDKVNWFGNKTYNVINMANLGTESMNYDAIYQGITNWRKFSAGKNKSIIKDYTDFLIKSSNNKTSAIIAANASFDVSAILLQLKNTLSEEEYEKIAPQVRGLYEKTADVISAAEAQASARGMSAAEYQRQLSDNYNPKAPVSVESQMKVNNIGSKETHVGGEDAQAQTMIAMNRFYDEDGKSYARNTVESIEKIKLKDVNYAEGYYIFSRGSFDKNDIDVAEIEGEGTQRYSYRKTPLEIDWEGSGWREFVPQSPEGVETEPFKRFVVHFKDGQNDVYKGFDNEYMARNFIAKEGTVLKEDKYIESQRWAKTIDEMRREYDKFFNPGDVAIKNGKEANGYNSLVSFMEAMKETEGYESLKDALADEKNVHLKEFFYEESDRRENIFNALSERIKSEEKPLREMINTIEANGANLSNTRKTALLSYMMNEYANEVSGEHANGTRISLLEDVFAIDIEGTNGEIRRLNGYSEEAIQRDLSKAFRNGSRNDIYRSIVNLKNRKIINRDEYNALIEQFHGLKEDELYTGLYKSMSMTLAKKLEPLKNIDNPIELTDYTVNTQYDDILTKIENETTHWSGRRVFVPEGSELFNRIKVLETKDFLTNKNLFLRSNEYLDDATSIAGKTGKTFINTNAYEKGIKYAKSLNKIEDLGVTVSPEISKMQNEWIANLGKSLNYSENEIKILQKEFLSNKKYGLNQRGIQTMVINPGGKYNSAFVLATNDANAQRLEAKVLDWIKENDSLEFDRLSDVEEAFGDLAGIIELKNIERIHMGSMKDFGIDPRFQKIVGSDQIHLNLVHQGGTIKILNPNMHVWVEEETGKLGVQMQTAGESLIGAYRRGGERFVESVLAGEFDTATRTALRQTNQSLKNLSSPSGYFTYVDKTGRKTRSFNMSRGDRWQSMMLEAEEFYDYVLRTEVKNIIQEGDKDASELVNMVRAFGISSGIIDKNKKKITTYDVDRILGMPESKSETGWHEFWNRTIQGNVSKDEQWINGFNQIPEIHRGASKELSNRSLMEMIMDPRNLQYAVKEGEYREENIKTLQEMGKLYNIADPVTGLSNTEKGRIAMVSVSQATAFQGASSSMRPTYGQVTHGMLFNPEDIDVSVLTKDEVIGPVMRAKSENVMMKSMATQGYKNPSGALYSSQESSIMTTVKNMSDFSLNVTYEDIRSQIQGALKDENVKTRTRGVWNLREKSFDIFTDMYKSLHEGKSFGAPILMNQKPFIESGLRKIELNLNDYDESVVKNFRKLIKEKGYIEQGDMVFGKKGRQPIVWNWESAYLDKENYADLREMGKTHVEPMERMVGGTKWMGSQEKSTVQFPIINERWAKKHGFNNEKEAMKYMQEMFDVVAGNATLDKKGKIHYKDGYRARFISNLSTLKHGVAASEESTSYIVINEFRKQGKLNTLVDIMNKVSGEGNFVEEVNGFKRIVSPQKSAGMAARYEKFTDIILNGDDKTLKPFGLTTESKAVANARREVKNALINNLLYLEFQRIPVNETMGEVLRMDERLQQSILLSAFETTDRNKVRESMENTAKYLNDLRESLDVNALDYSYFEPEGSFTRTGGSSKYYGIIDFMQGYTNLQQSDFIRNRMNRERRISTVVGMQQAILNYAERINGVEIPDIEAAHINIEDVIKNLDSKSNFDESNVQKLLFKVNGKESNFLKESLGNAINRESIYLDFNGHVINGRKSILIPIMNLTEMSDGQAYFGKSEQMITAFLRSYQHNIKDINTPEGNKRISLAMNKMFETFASDMSFYNKDSRLYNAVSRLELPNSGQFLALDETAPLTEAMFAEDTKTKYQEQLDILEKIRSGKGSQEDVDTYNTLQKEIKDHVKNVAERIRNNDQDESLYRFVGLTNNEFEKLMVKTENGWRIGNVSETGLEGFKKLRYNEGLVGLQILDNYLEAGSITDFETSEDMEKIMKKLHLYTSKSKGDLKQAKREFRNRIKEQLELEGIEITDKLEKDIKNLSKMITKDEKNLITMLNRYMETESVNKYTLATGMNQEIVERLKNLDGNNHMGLLWRYFKSLGLDYAENVGIYGRDLVRMPIFKAQGVSKIYLNKNIQGNQLRTLSPLGTVKRHTDFDGDLEAASVELNAGGLFKKDNKKIANIRNLYEQQLQNSTQLFADIITDMDAFKVNNVADVSRFRLAEYEKYDQEAYEKLMQTYIKKKGLNKSVSELTEADLTMATQDENVIRGLRGWLKNFDVINNPANRIASLAAIYRKGQIGSISTPNFKMRNTLLSIAYSDSKDAEKAIDIIQALTGFAENKLFNISEQKAIDVKHVFDAVTSAKTSAWATGVQKFFNGDDEGILDMMKAVRTAVMPGIEEERLVNIFNIVKETKLNDIDRFTEKLSKVFTDLSESDIYDLADFTNQYRAVYEMRSLEGAQELQTQLIRHATMSTEDYAKEIVRLLGYTKYDEMYKFYYGNIAAIEPRFIKHLNNEIYAQKPLIEKGRIYFRKGRETEAYFVDSMDGGIPYFKRVQMNRTLDENYHVGQIFEEDGTDFGFSKAETTEEFNRMAREIFEVTPDDELISINRYAFMNNVNGQYDEVMDMVYKNKSINLLNGLTSVTSSYSSPEYNRKALMLNDEFLSREKELKQIIPNFGDERTVNEEIANIKNVIRNDAKLQNKNIDVDKEAAKHIRKLNADIVSNPDRYKLNSTSYTDLLHQVAVSLSGSKEEFERISEKANVFKGFDEKLFKAKKQYITDSSYDIIGIRSILENALETQTNDIFITSSENSAARKEAENLIKDYYFRIDKITNELEEENKKLFSAMDEAINLFKTTEQMDSYFMWDANHAEQQLIGYGNYIGKRFDELTMEEVNHILDTQFDYSSQMGKYAGEQTKLRLSKYLEYHADDISKNIKNVDLSNTVIKKSSEASIFLENVGEFMKNNVESIEKARIASEKIARKNAKLQRKTVTGTIFNSLKDIDFGKHAGSIGLVTAGLAAIGIINNMINGQRTGNPLVPEHSTKAADISQQPVDTNNVAKSAPASPGQNANNRKTVYQSSKGHTFNVKGKTRDFINGKLNAIKMAATRGNSNVSIEQDFSSVSDNWLDSKFAEMV